MSAYRLSCRHPTTRFKAAHRDGKTQDVISSYSPLCVATYMADQNQNRRSYLILDRPRVDHLRPAIPSSASYYLKPCQQLHPHGTGNPFQRAIEHLPCEERHPKQAFLDRHIASRREDSQTEHHPLQTRNLSVDSPAILKSFFRVRAVAGFLLCGFGSQDLIEKREELFWRAARASLGSFCCGRSWRRGARSCGI